MTYCDDDKAVYHTYSYAEFGTVVQLVATFLHDQVGVRRGERLATILFNHDVAVVLYFAAWILGVTIVPINIEESVDKETLHPRTFRGISCLLLAHVSC